MAGEKFRKETLEEMFAWLEKEFPWAVDIVEKFLESEEEYPYEARLRQGGRDHAFDGWNQEVI